MKICSKCKASKSDDEFAKRSSSKDGLDSRCLVCVRENSKISREKNKNKNSQINLNKLLKKTCPICREEKNISDFGTNPGSKDGLRNECKQCRNFKSKDRYENDLEFREKESLRHSIIYQNNKAIILDRTKKWSKQNPDKKVEQAHRRRARLYGQLDFDLPPNFVNLIKENQNNKCVYCSIDIKNKYTIDHVIPISRGGKHSIENIVISCPTCNFSKHTKTLQEWLEFNIKLISGGINSAALSIICKNLAQLIYLKESDKIMNEIQKKIVNSLNIIGGWHEPFPGMSEISGTAIIYNLNNDCWISINEKGEIYYCDGKSLEKILEEEALKIFKEHGKI